MWGKMVKLDGANGIGRKSELWGHCEPAVERIWWPREWTEENRR